MSELIDNQAQRVRTLKDIIKRLHAGEAPETVRASLRELVQKTDYAEIMAMEQQLIAEGMPVKEIQAMCDLHSQVTRDVLVQLEPAPLEPGHPIDTFRRENQALRGVLARIKQALGAARAAADEAAAAQPLLELRQAFNDLMDIDKHYQRKEHLLFSCLERHGITGPSKVMWGKDDEIRDLLKEVGRAFRDRVPLPELAKRTEAAVAAVEEMIYKEEQILFPVCLKNFTADEWAEIWASSPRYGWCLVEPREGYRPRESAQAETVGQAGRGGVQLPTGYLNIEQLLGIFSTLPVDLTFVDENDRVAFFSEGPDRVFARSRAVIGRKVQHCHPPRSVEVVDRILSDFREGRQNVAEFWINFQGRFVHIRYFAVRDANGKYLGTLEVTQDITKIRELSGERRLLQYDEPAAVPAEQVQ
ncbi:MAG TPA: DUF438 domain-containing protein [Bryobacteraceae bacterium]|nr:DUF438 domain-containing protein [Bryobacteraceae bacterium]HPU72586.1 DUF438 domain-containing protein [Bryobacteraceae bacterium]